MRCVYAQKPVPELSSRNVHYHVFSCYDVYGLLLCIGTFLTNNIRGKRLVSCHIASGAKL